MLLMVNKHYYKIKAHIESRRFRLLLLATFLVLILPVFAGKGLLSIIVFVSCLSFLLIQSAIIASMNKPGRAWLGYVIVTIIILLYWLEPAGIGSNLINLVKFLLLAATFVFVTYYLLKFLRRSKEVNVDVIIVAINIYLLLGIIFGSLTFFLYMIIPDSYNIPEAISQPNFITFVYYSFITMSTVGYGDITPKIPETQTLAYLIAITGQLYVAIIIAFLVGKLLITKDVKDEE
jgi:voltage-gated potassium channel